MRLSCNCWTFGVFMFHHATLFAVKCQVEAPTNVRAVYSPETENITVTWEDPQESQPISKYVVSYDADTINRTDTFLKTKFYEFIPPILGTTYTIDVYIERRGERSPNAVTRIIAATPVYTTEGTITNVTLTGVDGLVWEVRHDSNTALVLFDDEVQTNNLANTTTTIQVYRDPSQVTLTFNGVVLENAGVYMSKLQSSTEVLSSFVLIVTVKPTTPVISAQSVAVVNTSVILKCRSESNSVPEDHGLILSYSWRINYTDIQSGTTYAVTDDALIIQKLEIMDKHNRYDCTATEEHGLTSNVSSLILDVIYGPQSVTFNSSSYVAVEERAAIPPITCSADCDPKCTLRWIKDGDVDLANGAVLNLGNADKCDDGEYSCEAIGDGNVTEILRTRRSRMVYIDVKYPASTIRARYSINSDFNELLEEGQLIKVRETDKLVITCTVDSDPLATIDVLNNENETLSGFHTVAFAKDSSCEDTGMYAFLAYNKYNDVPARRNFIVQVYCKPREMYTAQKNFEGKHDERIVFMSKVIAFPAPTATWDRNVTDYDVVPINDFTFNISAYVDIQGEENYGNYMVTISNTNGSDLRLEFVIKPKESPEEEYDMTVILFAILGISVFVALFGPRLFSLWTRHNKQGDNRLLPGQVNSEDDLTIRLNIPSKHLLQLDSFALTHCSAGGVPQSNVSDFHPPESETLSRIEIYIKMLLNHTPTTVLTIK